MFRKSFLTLAVLAVTLVPLVASAASPTDFFPLVPCGSSGQDPCTPCHLFESLENVINLVLYGITGPIAVFMIILSGGMILLYGANPAMLSRGKTLLTNTLLGVTIILVSWVATNFLIKSLVQGSATDNWYTFTCPSFLQQTAVPPSVGQPTAPTTNGSNPAPALISAYQKICDDKTALAQAYGVPSSGTAESPSLTTMMSCIQRDPIVSALINPAQRFTYDRDHPLCNLTRGRNVCGPCSHGTNGSCHYGGRTGKDGAEAVDYNWNHKSITYVIQSRSIVNQCPQGSLCRTAASEADLFDEIYRSLKKNGCDFKFLNFESDHTHVSTKACDMDGKGLNGRATPVP